MSPAYKAKPMNLFFVKKRMEGAEALEALDSFGSLCLDSCGHEVRKPELVPSARGLATELSGAAI